MKLFLKKPTETQELVQQVLSLATQVGAPASLLQSKQPDLGGSAPKTGTVVGVAQSPTKKMEWGQVVKLRRTVNEQGEGSHENQRVYMQAGRAACHGGEWGMEIGVGMAC